MMDGLFRPCRMLPRVLVFWLAATASLSARLADGIYADFETSMGGFTCRLDYAEAPLTCANFIGLAEGSKAWTTPAEPSRIRKEPFYNGLVFHRVIDGFMIQGGCPNGDGTGGPGYAFPDEFSDALRHDRSGILSMANSGEDSNGSQFFITLEATPWLDDVHSVFGEVVDGMGVVSNIGAVATDTNDVPLVPVVIERITILRIGDGAAAFDSSAEPLPMVEPVPLALDFSNGVPPSLSFSPQTCCEHTLYRSEDLSSWTQRNRLYWSVPPSNWISELEPLSAEFFKGVRVRYPQGVQGLAPDITGHTLLFEQGTNSISLTPRSGGTGPCSVLGSDDTLVKWEWHLEPYHPYLFFGTQGNSWIAFQVNFDSPDGIAVWNGYYYDGAQWVYMGDWDFTDNPPE